MKPSNLQKTIVLSIFLLIAVLPVMAQTDSLLADETNVTVFKNTYKIVTDNDVIPVALIKEYGDKANSYTVKNKKDRHGRYVEYIFYFPVEMRQELDYFIDHVERPKSK